MNEVERCIVCDEPTGRAGKDDDSLYEVDDYGKLRGPLCQDCYDEMGRVLFARRYYKIPFEGISPCVCGGTPELHECDLYWYMCPKCFRRGRKCRMIKTATASWNKRMVREKEKDDD